MSNKFVVNFKKLGIEFRVCIVSRNGDLSCQVHGLEYKVFCNEISLISYGDLLHGRFSYCYIARLNIKCLMVWVDGEIVKFIAYGGDLVAVMYLDDTNLQWIMQDPWHRREIRNLPCDIGFQW